MSYCRVFWVVVSVVVCAVALVASHNRTMGISLALSSEAIVWLQDKSGGWAQVRSARSIASIGKELQRLARIGDSYSVREVALWSGQSSYEAVKDEWKAMRRKARSLTTGRYWDNRFRDELRNRLDEMERARSLRRL